MHTCEFWTGLVWSVSTLCGFDLKTAVKQSENDISFLWLTSLLVMLVISRLDMIVKLQCVICIHLFILWKVTDFIEEDSFIVIKQTDAGTFLSVFCLLKKLFLWVLYFVLWFDCSKTSNYDK